MTPCMCMLAPSTVNLHFKKPITKSLLTPSDMKSQNIFQHDTVRQVVRANRDTLVSEFALSTLEKGLTT